MNPKSFRKAALYIMNLKVGDGYLNQNGNFVMCVKHSKKKVVLSNGQIFRYKVKHGNRYLVGDATGMVGLKSDTFYLAVLEVMTWFESRSKVKV
jgi:hypothetical protein